jgi:hypothetical protein
LKEINPTGDRPSAIQIALAVTFAATAMIAGYVNIGLPPVAIVGGSSVVGFALWLRTYRHGPIAPEVILPPFLLTVAALELHMIEEYATGFGPAMSRLFNISWSEFSFLLIFTFVGPVIYSLTALGLFWRVRFAGFVAWFIFIGPGVAELAHFVFPLLAPAIEPHNLSPVTTSVANGTLVANMPNFWLSATGRYYFPGLYTAVLPMIPGIYGIWTVLRADRTRRLAAAPTTADAGRTRRS